MSSTSTLVKGGGQFCKFASSGRGGGGGESINKENPDECELFYVRPAIQGKPVTTFYQLTSMQYYGNVTRKNTACSLVPTAFFTKIICAIL